MAGSFQHMTTKSGKLRSNESFTGMIGNLGDAYEAAEECYGMIWFLAEQLVDALSRDQPPREVAYLLDAEFYTTRSRRDRVRQVVRLAGEKYKDGLQLGGVQKSGD